MSIINVRNVIKIKPVMTYGNLCKEAFEINLISVQNVMATVVSCLEEA